jgi:hypothetical protein
VLEFEKFLKIFILKRERVRDSERERERAR